jgi:hypothetical protein
MAIRHRPFLSQHTNGSRLRYCKGAMSNANCAGMPPPVAPVRRRMAAGPRSLLGPGKACPWARLRRDPRGRTRGLDLPYVLRARSCAGGVAADRRSGHNSTYMRQGTKSDIHGAMSRNFFAGPIAPAAGRGRRGMLSGRLCGPLCKVAVACACRGFHDSRADTDGGGTAS